jgi:hypothetical protein
MDDLEQIKQLKARYCFLVDTKRWSEWRRLFTDDCVVDVQLPHTHDVTPDEFVAAVSHSLANVRSVHQVHAPVIELLGPERARGVWAMFDWLELPPDHQFHRQGQPHRIGYGYYEEEYRRQEGTWRISILRLRRLRVDRVGSDGALLSEDPGAPPNPADWLPGASRE